MKTLKIATKGYLNSTLSIGTRGYLSTEKIIVKLPSSNSSGGGFSLKYTNVVSNNIKKNNTNDKLSELFLSNDKEIMLILKIFLRCQ